MKHNISFLLFGLLTWLFAACNTDDLEKDIDALTERVENVEAQVLRLNDNMNIIRVMLDGNKTITAYSQDGDTYTLTLSNGETYTLTPGVVGGNYPPITIGNAGTWIINGEDTGKRALATNGTDATVTPQFKIENDAWWVSYDNKVTWEQLANGVPTGTNTYVNPITEAKVDGNNFVITMSGSEYTIPIVQDLICAINKEELAERLVNGIWMISEVASFQVTVKAEPSDVVRVKAPVEWKVMQGAIMDGVMQVTVTPPTDADECTLVVELTRGVHTVTDQLQVRTVTDSYYADYLAGLDIMIGDVAVNKYDNPGAKLVENGATISEEGCYFIEDGATVTLSKIGEVTLIAEKKSGFGSGVKTTVNTSSIIGTLLCKGIRFFGENITRKYWLNIGGSSLIDKVYFEECKIELPEKKGFTYFSNGVGIQKIFIVSCYVSRSSSDEVNFLNLNTRAFGNIEIRNNVFYYDQQNGCNSFCLLTKGSGTVDVVTVENNTFINLANWSGNKLIATAVDSDWNVKNNLFWYSSEKSPNSKPVASLFDKMLSDATFNANNFSGNQVCTSLENTSWEWKVFYQSAPAGFTNTLPVALNTTPFVEDSEPHKGIYTLTPEYAALGAGAVIK